MYEEELTIFHQLLYCRKVQHTFVIFQHTNRSIRHNPRRGPAVRTAGNSRIIFFPPLLRFLFDSSYVGDSSLLGCDTVSLCELVLTLQRIMVPSTSLASSSRRPLTHEDTGTTHPKTQCKIAKDLSAGNMGFRPHG